jgi:hypothetical protein
MICGGLANEARQCFCGNYCEISRQNERDELTFLRAAPPPSTPQSAAPVGDLTAKAAVSYLIDHIEYSDSYGVEGSSFQACLLCTGGGAPGVALVHDKICPVLRCETIAAEWVEELNDERAAPPPSTPQVIKDAFYAGYWSWFGPATKQELDRGCAELDEAWAEYEAALAKPGDS